GAPYRVTRSYCGFVLADRVACRLCRRRTECGGRRWQFPYLAGVAVCRRCAGDRQCHRHTGIVAGLYCQQHWLSSRTRRVAPDTTVVAITAAVAAGRRSRRHAAVGHTRCPVPATGALAVAAGHAAVPVCTT